MKAGYRVLYWDDISDPNAKVLNEPTYSKANKLVTGKISKKKNTADEFVFTIAHNNPYYQKLVVIKGLVKVINLFDDSVVFYGRIIDIAGSMSSEGRFSQEVTCESSLAYLHDMTLAWEKRPNRGPEEYFRYIIKFHNDRVEAHKRFKVGRVTVKNRTDLPYLYITFESTWECIKNRLIDKFGGYIVMRTEPDGNYIDYLEEVGEHKQTPIQLGRNIKSANKTVSLADMMTQIVPIGADDESYNADETGTTSDIIRPQVHIGTVNGGKMRLEDAELMKKFGIIRKIVVWSEINDPRILKARGEQYLRDQKVAMANWKVSVVERSLIDPRYEKFELYNYHPILNAPLSGIEELQIIGIDIDITQPQTVELEIGADSLTISAFQLQQAAAQKSIEKLNQDLKAQQAKNEAERQRLLAQITSLTQELERQQNLLNNSEANQEVVAQQIARLQSQIAVLQEQLNSKEGRTDELQQSE
ncbi:phage tail protein [Streptococcus sp. zg-JUN1979]|uniref:phage tail protein n=1 Tax=Streptococcus sp. zg-JUN1979 TaxID=3391450 RepID=UPI0039A4F11A